MVDILIKAMDSAREGISISDATNPENPLLYVNDGFTRMTGYTSDEILGRNCRFLQGDMTNPRAVRQVRDAMKKQVPVQVELLNYTKNGEPFWNRLSITPIFDADQRLTHFIGVQDDITAAKQRREEALKTYTDRIILQTTASTQEKERKEFGKEMHDNVNQLLASATLYLSLARDQEDQRLPMIHKARQIVQNAIEEIRVLSKRMVSPVLATKTLSEVLSQLAEDQQIGAQLNISLSFQSFHEEMLCDEKKLMVYRIAQEQLHNIYKYASATNVMISLEVDEQDLLFTIQDDGVGFDTSKLSTGIGLQNIQERLNAVQGSMIIASAPGSGCRLSARFPLG